MRLQPGKTTKTVEKNIKELLQSGLSKELAMSAALNKAKGTAKKQLSVLKSKIV